jgi:hypothetical protein
VSAPHREFDVGGPAVRNPLGHVRNVGNSPISLPIARYAPNTDVAEHPGKLPGRILRLQPQGSFPLSALH